MRSNRHQPSRPVDKGVKKQKVTGDMFGSKVPVPNEEVSKEERVLKDSSYFFKSMLDTMLNPILYKDRNGVYLGINESFARQVFGLPEGEIVGHTLPEVCNKFIEMFPNRSIVHGRHFTDVCREWEREDAELLKSGGFKTHEQEMILANGTKGIFLVNRSTFKDENGEILGLVTVLQDITELKMSEKALEENEERYRVVTEQTGQLVYDNDIENNKVSWAGAVKEVFGYRMEEVKKFNLKDWIEHIHLEDRSYVLEKFTQARKAGGRSRVEYRLRRKDGTYVYVEDIGTYLVNEDGVPYRVLGVVKNITERKLSQERLEKSEEKYRSFTQNFKGIAFQLDENLVPEFVHGAVEEITGYSEEEFKSTSVWWDNNVCSAFCP